MWNMYQRVEYWFYTALKVPLGDMAVLCPCFLVLNSNGWADFLSKPVLPFENCTCISSTLTHQQEIFSTMEAILSMKSFWFSKHFVFSPSAGDTLLHILSALFLLFAPHHKTGRGVFLNLGTVSLLSKTRNWVDSLCRQDANFCPMYFSENRFQC